ncbi:MAG: protease family protein [Acidimicrobiales bacterium]|nr:protease family protein [Acidimicrobiales bacterium]
MGGAFASYALGHRSDRPVAAASTTTAGASAPSSTLDIRRILDVAQPSVVSIQTGSANSIFGAAGSGVVISKDGLILTNAHVIEGASDISVRFNDGTASAAKVVGRSKAHDIALIKVARADLTPARLGSSANLRVGDDVVAIGNALNLGGDPSVTRGIVSAKDRSISDGKTSLDHLIQTDAAINPGNSGGPLVDASGDVVGINTAIIDGAQNVGFSIAIDSVQDLIAQLKAGGGDSAGAATAVLGVSSLDVNSSEVSDATRRQYGVTATAGAFIVQVDPAGAASAAGIEQGDVVVDLDGAAISGAQDLTDAVGARKPGDRVHVTVERKGQRRTFEVTLGG